MSKLQDRRTRRDQFHQRAQKAGFRARSVFKLEELDQQFDLLHAGDRVLDLGCAPGSWLQYARTRIGEAAPMVGLDRAPLAAALPGARIMVGDVHTITPAELLGVAGSAGVDDRDGALRALTAFDVVLSDMAPDTTGVRHVDQSRSEALFERALELAIALLAPGGNFVGKLFQGPDFKRLGDLCRTRFAQVKYAKPASSRSISIEQYVVARGFRGEP
jgi:23S rRNA (uridine2552-2'-O)-methyltransferase